MSPTGLALVNRVNKWMKIAFHLHLKLKMTDKRDVAKKHFYRFLNPTYETLPLFSYAHFLLWVRKITLWPMRKVRKNANSSDFNLKLFS
jgi:hypothetical protein